MFINIIATIVLVSYYNMWEDFFGSISVVFLNILNSEKENTIKKKYVLSIPN